MTRPPPDFGYSLGEHSHNIDRYILPIVAVVTLVSHRSSAPSPATRESTERRRDPTGAVRT